MPSPESAEQALINLYLHKAMGISFLLNLDLPRSVSYLHQLQRIEHTREIKNTPVALQRSHWLLQQSIDPDRIALKIFANFLTCLFAKISTWNYLTY
jgi:hypothetical protein